MKRMKVIGNYSKDGEIFIGLKKVYGKKIGDRTVMEVKMEDKKVMFIEDFKFHNEVSLSLIFIKIPAIKLMVIPLWLKEDEDFPQKELFGFLEISLRGRKKELIKKVRMIPAKKKMERFMETTEKRIETIREKNRRFKRIIF